MENAPNNQEKNERYKRVPVYTKEHYGSPKPEPTNQRVLLIKEILLPIAVILGCAAYFIYPAIRPKQAWQIEKETNEWYSVGSYNLCEEHLKEQLRDPKSYERAGEIKVIKDNGKEKSIVWEFRARNGFGGMNMGEGVCLIKKGKKWVAATIK
jgi:hypothetical protein